MNIKRNQKILGTSALIAVAVILLPLFFSKDHKTPMPTLPSVIAINPPPFPDQITPVNSHNSIVLTQSNHPSVHLTENDLIKLKNPAWVVQLGSFKNKTNAAHLINKLRTAGYHAFTREVKVKYGTQVRVYVGPEFKQMAALKLSSDIARDVHMQGIVVAYKPLAL